jgi:hypothetical protein
MKYSVFYPTSISEIEDIHNGNIDVCVTCEDGRTFTFVFITPENLNHLMIAENKEHIDFRFKFIVIKELSEKIIEEVLKEIMSEEYFCNFYGTDSFEQ